MNAQVAQHLNVAESAILEIQEWARVLWVRVRGIGARFVSKKVVKVDKIQEKRQQMATKLQKMAAKLEASDFWIFEEDESRFSFAKHFYNRVGLGHAVQEAVNSLNGDQVLANERRTKLVAAIKNCCDFILNVASERFIKDNASFASAEVLSAWFKLANKK